MSDRRRDDEQSHRWDGPWRGEWWDDDEDDGELAGIAALLVLGLGLASLFGLVPLGPFWAIFAIGFAVVVPLVAILEERFRGSDDAEVPRESEVRSERTDQTDDDSLDAALDRLRDRYARGDLSDEQFEHKLEVLLETDTPESARERTERRRRETERERGRESPETET
ncbi:SHOCT domain-containing protein [Halogeometricum limi]|uniref:Short C-terminal domain-containing protein n=1 Tax=Halogeometricum limi TaxID=555875 RepID=A0A1I6FTL1_9EURY|nr:SHOCT domain-containing protein [Halogeometricum limi]SFR33295.1 Short C-terminal domain-containing protein [Halogeometricum limi]